MPRPCDKCKRKFNPETRGTRLCLKCWTKSNGGHKSKIKKKRKKLQGI
jgi:hypothetical protein